MRNFLQLPLTHAEDLAVQEVGGMAKEGARERCGALPESGSIRALVPLRAPPHQCSTPRIPSRTYPSGLPYMLIPSVPLTIHPMQKGVELAAAAVKELEAAGPSAAAAAQYMATVLSFAVKHRDVVAAWGRFPHRNAILGRDSTPEELAGLADGSIHKF